jgi:hypothetical protein
MSTAAGLAPGPLQLVEELLKQFYAPAAADEKTREIDV